MKLDADFAVLDGMLDATLDALTRRANADVSFSTDDEGIGAEVGELWQLIELAREGGEQPLSFSTDVGGEGMLDRARRECSQLMRQTFEFLSQAKVVETGEGYSSIRTRVDWVGNVDTHFIPGVSVVQVTAHVAAMEASLVASRRRLHLVMMVMEASGRIAAVLTTPGATVMALPIAYRCVRDIYEQWSASSSDSILGERLWQ